MTFAIWGPWRRSASDRPARRVGAAARSRNSGAAPRAGESAMGGFGRGQTGVPRAVGALAGASRSPRTCCARPRPAPPSPGPGPYGPLAAADANGIQLPAGFTSRVIGTDGPGGRRHRVHVARRARRRRLLRGDRRRLGLRRPTARSRRRSAGSARSASTPTATIVDGLPDPRRHEPQLRRAGRRRGARGCRARRTARRARVGVRPAGGRARACAPAAGHLRPRGRRRRPGTGARVPHRGRPGRSPLPLHADDTRATSPPGRCSPPTCRAPRSPGCRPSSTAPTARPTAPRRSTAARARGSPGARCGSPPRATAGSGSSTSTTQQLVGAVRRLADAGAPLNGVDNITVHEPSGDLFVAEDGGNMELCLITTVDAAGHGGAVPPVRRPHAAPRSPDPPSRPTAPACTSARSAAPTAPRASPTRSPGRSAPPPPPPPPPPVLVAQDLFGRTVSSSWGSADLGWGVDARRDGGELLGGGWGRSDRAGRRGADPGDDARRRVGGRCRRDDRHDVRQGADGQRHQRGAGREEGRHHGVPDARAAAHRPAGCCRSARGERRGDHDRPATLPGGAYPPGPAPAPAVPGGRHRIRTRCRARPGSTRRPSRRRGRSRRSTRPRRSSGRAGSGAAYVAQLDHQRPGHRHLRQLPSDHPGVEPPPPNDRPHRRLRRHARGLTVGVDGSSSTDPDGSIATYAWAFGDGCSASGAVARRTSHTYAAAAPTP